jgi:hypothetical protein
LPNAKSPKKVVRILDDSSYKKKVILEVESEDLDEDDEGCFVEN